MAWPLLIAGALIYCQLQIPKDMRSEVYYDPYGCRSCPDIRKDIQFHLYTTKNTYRPYNFNPDNSTLEDFPFNPKHRTVIVVHGFTGNGKTDSSLSTKDAYFRIGGYNVISVDWGKLARAPDYCNAINRMPVTGTYIAQMIRWLEDRYSLSRKDLQVVGFSLGAHVSGLVGEALARIDPGRGKIGRITGLDPAGPAFEASNGLDASDADFVDIMHTNTLSYGIKKQIGHADFYVNYGYRQPGCSIFSIGCSHMRAWQLYAESLTHKYEFPAFRCEQPGKWKYLRLLSGVLYTPQDSCAPHLGDYMGFVASPKSQGRFTVFTKKYPPFGIDFNIESPTQNETSLSYQFDNIHSEYYSDEIDSPNFDDDKSNDIQYEIETPSSDVESTTPLDNEYDCDEDESSTSSPDVESKKPFDDGFNRIQDEFEMSLNYIDSTTPPDNESDHNQDEHHTSLPDVESKISLQDEFDRIQNEFRTLVPFIIKSTTPKTKFNDVQHSIRSLSPCKSFHSKNHGVYYRTAFLI